MSRLGWTADGIERARAAGGVELETYRRPDFVAEGIGVRRSESSAGGSGIALDPKTIDPDWDEYEERLVRRRGRR